MKSDAPGGKWASLSLLALAIVVGFVGLVLIDLRDDVLIGEEPNTETGIIGMVFVGVAVLLLVTAVLWRPVRRIRRSLHREVEAQRLYEDTHE